MKKMRNRLIYIIGIIIIEKIIKMLTGIARGKTPKFTGLKKVNKNYLKLLKNKPGRENIKEVIKI